MKAILMTIAFCLPTPTLLAQISYSTGVNPVYYRGSHELGGSFQTICHGDVFPDASPQTPAYMAVFFEKAALLGHTLVDLTSDDPFLNRPIYIPLALESPSPSVSISAPGDTMAIVRWVAGENKIWVRIQTSTANWLQFEGGETGPPSEDHAVVWSLGRPARSVAEELQQITSNLPFPTKNLSASSTDYQEAHSLIFCFNLTTSTLETSGLNSELPYFVQFYDQTAEVTPGFFQEGTLLDIQQSGTWRIARGVDIQISALFSTTANPLPVCSEESTGTVRNTLGLDISRNLPAQFAKIYDGTYMQLTVPPQANYGFDERDVFFSGPDIAPGLLEINADSAFNLNGVTLYRELKLTWTSGTRSLADLTAMVDATLHYPCDARPSDLTLNYQLVVMDTEPPWDQAPFDGDHQQKGCQQDGFTAGEGIWRHNTAPDVGRISHITQPGNGFTTHIIIANTSDSPQDYELFPYTREGEPLPEVTGSLEPGEANTFEATLLFGSDETAHFRYNATSAIEIIAVYQADRENTAPAHVGASSHTASRWLIYPGNTSITWDGVAVVNAGGVPGGVDVTQYQPDGQVINQISLHSALNPEEKILAVFSDLFESRPGSYFEIKGTAPLSVMSLRGDLESQFLWENRAIPLDL